jgi:hypothetical protein
VDVVAEREAVLNGFITAIPDTRATNLAYICSCPTASIDYEPMFASLKTVTTQIADAFDLVIEFSTLGEYGLEYPDPEGHRPLRRCEEGRRRLAATAEVRPAERRFRSPGPESPCSTAHTDFASALRPPRISISFTE